MGLAGSRVADADAGALVQLRAHPRRARDPYHYGEADAPPVADLGVPSLVSVGAVSYGEAVVRAPSSRPRRSRATSTHVPDHVSGGTHG